MRVLGIMFWMGVLGGLGCLGGPVGEPVGTHSEALTAGQVNALNNVGRSTGITYRLSVHPDPDLPVLSMAFAPIADLVRAVDVYPPDPGAPQFASLTTYPPDPGVPASAKAVCDAAAGGLATRVVAYPPDPDYPPDPGRVAVSVSTSLGGSPFVELSQGPPDPILPPGAPAAPSGATYFVVNAGGFRIEGWGQPPDPDRPARATWFQVLDTTSNERSVFASSSCPATQECSP
jgi:hypothetical protein